VPLSSAAGAARSVRAIALKKKVSQRKHNVPENLLGGSASKGATYGEGILSGVADPVE